MAYAEGTTVDFDKSIAEIITLLRRAGAGQISQFDDDIRYAIQITLAGRMIRFHLPLPALDEMPTHDGRRNALSREQRGTRLAQARRQRGRALLLAATGTDTIEDATRIALGRPRLDEDRAESVMWRVRATGRLDNIVAELADREGISRSALIREAVAEYARTRIPA